MYIIKRFCIENLEKLLFSFSSSNNIEVEDSSRQEDRADRDFSLTPSLTGQIRPCLDVVVFTLIHMCWCGLGWNLVQVLLQSISTHVD